LALGCSLVRMAWHCFRSHAWEPSIWQ
jgi:hypothetical protein